MSSMELSVIQRPVCVHILPDLVRPCYTPNDIISNMIAAEPEAKNISFVMDSYFGDLDWLSRTNEPVIAALSSSEHDLLALFGYGLLRHQYRVFYNGKVMVSV